MSIFEAVILGAVQGITEFLPVSSSGHLVLLQRLFGIAEPVLLFDTMVHGGTLLAVFAALRWDVGGLLARPIQPLTGFLILGTLPAAAAGLAGKRYIEWAFHSGALLGFSFLFTALVLLLCEGLARGASLAAPFAGETERRYQSDMYWLDALIIGVFQAAAIMPGVSRSGLTLSGALARRFDRDFVARFSFLLSIPAILGALVLQIKDLRLSETAGIGIVPLLAGTAAAAAVGFFSITLTLALVRRYSLLPFACYTGVLGALVLLDRHISHFFF